jgi:hypothetical protein
VPDVGDDPFRGMSRPATVVDSRRLQDALRPIPVTHHIDQPFEYATAIAAIVAVTRFRTLPVPTRPAPPIH